jgi:hypothetical protein
VSTSITPVGRLGLTVTILAFVLMLETPAVASGARATFVYPTNGSTNVETSKAFTWSRVPDAQAYYVYVGSTEDGKDLVDSGALSASITSYLAPPLPVGATLWARVWTKIAGAWAYSPDISFQVSKSASRFTYPKPGMTAVDTRKPFTWSAAPDAQAYYLHVGTSPGALNLVDSGTTTATSWAVPPMPIGQTLYARIYTEIDGSWSTYTEVSFTVAYAAAPFSNPSPGQNSPNQDVTRPFSWTPLAGASGYAVWIGTTPGARDIGESGQLPSSQSTYLPRVLPAGGQLWARLWTLANGTWIHSADVPFTPAARIIRPTQQAIAASPTQPFTWTPGAVLSGRNPSYELMIGTRPGGGDLYDSGMIGTTSVAVPAAALRAGGELYARVIVKLGDGTQRRADSVFAMSGTIMRPSELNWGSAGSQAVDTSHPFAWDASDLAQGYRFEVSDGSSMVVDSGPIHVSEYFAESLQPGSYTARLGTELGGSWWWTSSPFTVVRSASSAESQIAAAHWATDFVRHMADIDGFAYQWSDLWQYTNARWPRVMTTCGVYALELLNVLAQMNVAASQPAAEQPKSVSIAFLADDADDHVVDDFWDSDDGDWIVLDPTFDIAMQRTTDGHWATAQDAHLAIAAQDWSAISYVPLGDFGFSIAKAYYLDYPLLYLNVPETARGAGADPTPYLSPIDPWPDADRGVYMAQSSQTPIELVIDGDDTSVDTSAAGGYSKAFSASSVAPSSDGEQVELFTPARHVF